MILVGNYCMESQQRIDDLLDLWEELHLHGVTLSAEQLCKDVPDLLPEVARRIVQLEEMDELLHVPDDTTPIDEQTAQESAKEEELPCVPGYKVLRRVGHGGMGIVYKAWDEELHRLVAIKMLLGRQLAEDRERFRREARAQAQLDHPNILRIYHVGDQGGQPYFVMEFAEQESLLNRVRKENLFPPEEAARVVKLLAEGLHQAHESGIIHRDIKPANVLVMKDGTAKLADFGLAKWMDESTQVTATGTVLGTLQYMAPEQAEGKREQVGRAADVYSLGATLYTLLTGKPPFSGSRAEILTKVLSQEPVPAHDRLHSVPRDLEAICSKCMEKDPARRYATAQQLADDLGRFLRGEPTIAKPISWPARQWRRIRRHRTGILLAALVLLLVGTLSGALVVQRMNSSPFPRKTPEEIAREESEQRLQAALEDLRQGKAVTLIDKKGYPIWRKWVVGQRSGTEALNSKGFYDITNTRITMVELLPEIPAMPFRLSAEISHTAAVLEGGEAGLYLGYESQNRSDGTTHYFYRYSYSDHLLLGKQRFVPAVATPLIFRFVRYPEEVEGTRGMDSYKFFGAMKRLQPEPPFDLKKIPWRELALTVSHKQIQLYEGDDPKPFRELESSRFRGRAQQWLERLKPAPKKPLQLNLQGPFGLFVLRGSALFRSVRIEPLKEEMHNQK